MYTSEVRLFVEVIRISAMIVCAIHVVIFAGTAIMEKMVSQ